MAVTKNNILDMAREHGITSPLVHEPENERLLREQRDTVAFQWMTENLALEVTARSCLFCAFVAASRTSLKTHMRAKHSLG